MEYIHLYVAIIPELSMGLTMTAITQRPRLDLTRVQWLMVKRLYLQREWRVRDICIHLKLPLEMVIPLTAAISYRGWPKQRRDSVAVLNNTTDSVVTTAEGEELQRIDAWTDQSAELVEKSFEMGLDAIDSKGLMQCSIAARGYVDIYNKAKAMKSPVAGGLRVAGIALILVQPAPKPNVPIKTAQPVEFELITEDVGL